MTKKQYGDYQFDIYFDGLEGQTPNYPVDYAALERAAAEVLPPWVLSYVAGGAGDESTQRANVDAFSRYGIVPRMLDVAQNPVKLTAGLGGTVLLSLLNVTALWASVKAVSPQGAVSVSFATAAVVFLTGQAAGSLFPTPGGIGGVEASLTLLLTTLNVGLGATVAASAVLLFRILTFWLPVLPGWFCFNRMQKRAEL